MPALAAARATMASSAPAPAVIVVVPSAAICAEGAAGQADHHALHPAVADEDVGADAQHRYGHRRVKRLRKSARSSASAGRNSTSAGAADPEPGEGRQRLVAQQLAADGREAVAPGHGHPTARRLRARLDRPALVA